MSLSLVVSEPDVAFYTRQAEERGGPVLVLGSAQGHLAWALGERGLSVLGVEPSERMVATAEQQRAALPESVSKRVRFLASDLRSLRLAERFPVVLAPHNALGLMGSQDELEALAATVRHHLAPGGVFAFDAPSAQGERPEPHPAPPVAALVPLRPVFTLHLRERRQAGRPTIHRLRLSRFSTEQVEQALAACGLTLRERYGRFEGKPYDVEDTLQIGVADG